MFAICDPVIDRASLKLGLSDVKIRMCIQQEDRDDVQEQ